MGEHMFRKCKHCNNIFKGEGYFCSDVCEIKNHTSEVMTYEKYTIISETKEKFDQVREGLPETPILGQTNTKVSVETSKSISNKFDKSDL